MFKAEDYPTFDDIRNDQLKTWNRCAMWLRAWREGGSAYGTQYLQGLPREGSLAVISMLKEIENSGFSNTRASVMRSMSNV